MNKYRVWCENKQEWENGKIFLTPKGHIYEKIRQSTVLCDSKTHIIEFSTGLQDKNGKDSYFNDICNYCYWVQTSADPDSKGVEFSGVGIVVFIEGAFMIEDIKTKHRVPFHYQELSFETIGNVHQNKDLLK